jgi:hypothetical protein
MKKTYIRTPEIREKNRKASLGNKNCLGLRRSPEAIQSLVKSRKVHPHKIECTCCVCRVKRKEFIHKNNCQCYICKAKRGESKGINSPAFGVIRSKEFCENLRIIWSKKWTGEGNPMWKGGISFAPYPLGWTKTFKEQIRYRDGYKCQICGVSEVENGRRLCIHHIDYDKMNISLENLVSCCSRCHAKTNLSREYWIEYFKSKEVIRHIMEEFKPIVDDFNNSKEETNETKSNS